MISKSARRFVARVAVVLLVFGQIATTGYACQLGGTAAPPAAAHVTAHSGAGHGPCAGEAPDNAHANACEVHCTDSIAAESQADLPPVILAALPAGALPLSEPVATNATPRAAIDPTSGAPPVALRFCRLLI